MSATRKRWVTRNFSETGACLGHLEYPWWDTRKLQGAKACWKQQVQKLGPSRSGKVQTPINTSLRTSMSLLLLLALLVDQERHRWLQTVSILISFWIGQQATRLCHIHVIHNPLQCKQVWSSFLLAMLTVFGGQTLLLYGLFLLQEILTKVLGLLRQHRTMRI